MVTRQLCSITPPFDQKLRNANPRHIIKNKRHLQETVRNRKLAKKSVRDRYSLEKLLEEALADEEANANELEMSAKETQDGVQQDSDANVDRVKVGKDSNRNANHSRRKVDGKAREEPRVGKKVASAPVADVG